MAIDTQNKRRSVSGYCCSTIYPVADGAITAPDRASVAWLYSGITYAAAVLGALRQGVLKLNMNLTLTHSSP